MDRSELDEENPLVSRIYAAMRESENDDEIDSFFGANPFASKATGKVAPPSGSPGSVSVTNARKAPMGASRPTGPLGAPPKPAAATPTGPRTDMPQYDGTFVGQVADAGKQGAYKNVSWKGADAQRKYGKVHSMQANEPWVWDGSSWIKSAAFDAKFRNRNEGVSIVWNVLAENFLRSK